MGYVPVDQCGNVIDLPIGVLASGMGGPCKPEMLTEEELDYGIAPDSTSTPLRPPEEEYLQVWENGSYFKRRVVDISKSSIVVYLYFCLVEISFRRDYNSCRVGVVVVRRRSCHIYGNFAMG